MPHKKRCNMKIFYFITLIILGVSQTFGAPYSQEFIQAVSDEEDQQLREIFPQADLFSIKSGALLHHNAYKTDPESGVNTLVGFVFMTDEVEPDEWAYGGEIEALVGMTTEGVITKVKIVDHYEPFGYFSIDPPEFATQFDGKSILERFEEGYDVDSVTGATITVDGAARVIRKSARRIARAYIARTNSEK